MPRQITNRKRNYQKSASEKKQFMQEGLIAVAYIVGAAAFLVGSVLFLPSFEKYATEAAWLFVLGSLVYLAVTAFDLIEMVAHMLHSKQRDRKTILQLVTSVGYVIGCILFLVGSVLFFPGIGLKPWGGIAFIVGSALFGIGACISITQITQAGSLFTLQLMNAVTICFIIGSLLFLVASVPYLWDNLKSEYGETLFTYLGGQWVFACFLFLVGGLFNFYRVYAVYQRENAAN